MKTQSQDEGSHSARSSAALRLEILKFKYKPTPIAQSVSW